MCAVSALSIKKILTTYYSTASVRGAFGDYCRRLWGAIDRATKIAKIQTIL